MKSKKIIMWSAAIMALGAVIAIFVLQNTNGCATLQDRERRLREISNLGEAVNIEEELFIDGYVVSGYTAKNNRYGLALFAPAANGSYGFQTNVNRERDRLVLLSTLIGHKHYDIFWANRANLDHAEITYTISGRTEETLILDAGDNQIIYTEAPARDYSVHYIFVDKNGTRHE